MRKRTADGRLDAQAKDSLDIIEFEALEMFFERRLDPQIEIDNPQADYADKYYGMRFDPFITIP